MKDGDECLIVATHSGAYSVVISSHLKLISVHFMAFIIIIIIIKVGNNSQLIINIKIIPSVVWDSQCSLSEVGAYLNSRRQVVLGYDIQGLYWSSGMLNPNLLND